MEVNRLSFIKLHLFNIILFLIVPATLFSQEEGSCAEKLKMAQTLFENGQVDQVPAMLRVCMKSGFTREESLLAYKLLIQSYLFDDELIQADSAMLSFLKKNPEYLVSPTDHSAFVNLYNEFTVKPLVQISVHLGTSMPFLTFVSPLTASGVPGKSDYSTGVLNLSGSLEAKFALNRRLELNAEAGYSQLAFTNTKELSGVGNSIYKETQRRLEFPLSLTGNAKSFGIFTPYGRIGVGPALTISSNVTAEFSPFDVNGTPITGNDLDRKDSRIAIDFFVQAGAGIKLKTRGGFIFAELRSNFGLKNQTVRQKLPDPGSSAEELGYHYSYIDDDFNLNSINLNFGYTQIFYKPKRNR